MSWLVRRHGRLPRQRAGRNGTQIHFCAPASKPTSRRARLYDHSPLKSSSRNSVHAHRPPLPPLHVQRPNRRQRASRINISAVLGSAFPSPLHAPRMGRCAHSGRLRPLHSTSAASATVNPHIADRCHFCIVGKRMNLSFTVRSFVLPVFPPPHPRLSGVLYKIDCHWTWSWRLWRYGEEVTATSLPDQPTNRHRP
jgi:hypothetical protein